MGTRGCRLGHPQRTAQPSFKFSTTHRPPPGRHRQMTSSTGHPSPSHKPPPRRHRRMVTSAGHPPPNHQSPRLNIRQQKITLPGPYPSHPTQYNHPLTSPPRPSLNLQGLKRSCHLRRGPHCKVTFAWIQANSNHHEDPRDSDNKTLNKNLQDGEVRPSVDD